MGLLRFIDEAFRLSVEDYKECITEKFNFTDYKYENENNTELTTKGVIRILGFVDPSIAERAVYESALKELTGHPSKRRKKSRRRVFYMPPQF